MGRIRILFSLINTWKLYDTEMKRSNLNRTKAAESDVESATPAAVPGSPEFDDLDFPSRKPAAAKANKQPATYKR